jgi:hypothetical protein
MTRIALLPCMLALSVSALSECLAPKRILASEMPEQASAPPQRHPPRVPPQLPVLLAAVGGSYGMASLAIASQDFAALSSALDAVHSAERQGARQQTALQRLVQAGVPKEGP